MTPHYDLKQQEKKTMMFLGLGWAGGGGAKNIFVIYLEGSSMFFQRDLGGGGGVVKSFAYYMKM